MFFLLIIIPEKDVFGQSAVNVTGTVVNGQTGQPLPFVHIYTRSYKRGTISDDQGKFALTIDRADTLTFSSVGYDNEHFHPDPGSEAITQDVRIELTPRIYELEPVNVTAYPSIEQFKQDVLALEPAKDEKFELRIPKGYVLPPEGPGDVNLNPSIGIRGPATALYDAFSREAKERKKLEQFHQRVKDFREIDLKYNIDVVKQVTDLDDEGAKRFMEWCKFEDEFILKSSAYDLAVAMLKCLDEFARADTLR